MKIIMKENIMEKFAKWLMGQQPFVDIRLSWMTIENITDISEKLNNTLFKIYVFPNSKKIEYWKSKSKYLILLIDEDRCGSKKPFKFEKSDYFEWLFYDYFCVGNNIISSGLNRKLNKICSKKKKEKQRKNWNILYFYEKCEEFYNILCPMLEKNDIKWGIVDCKLDEF